MMTGDTDTERWIGSIVGLSTYASALMRRRSLPGRRERMLARIRPSTLIGDAASAALIAPMDGCSMPGISSSRATFNGMATMLAPGRRPGMADLRRFARLHHEAAEAMLPACLEAEGTLRTLRATLKREGDMRDVVGYSDRVSGRSERYHRGWGTYATNIGRREEADRPGMTAVCLSPAAMFAVHAARHLIAAPLLARETAGDAAILDMAAAGWIPGDALKPIPSESGTGAKGPAAAVLAAMGDDAWPYMPHTDPDALTWMMGPDMAPAIDAERACMRWHAMSVASPYDIAWASAALSDGYRSMDGHDMAFLCEAAGDLVISLGFGPATPVPVPEPRHVIGISGIAGMKPMRRWTKLSFVCHIDSTPADPADDGPVRRAYRMVADDHAWPLASPDVAGTSAFLDSVGHADAFGRAAETMRRILPGKGVIGDGGALSTVKMLEAPVWRGMEASDRLRAILLAKTVNGMIAAGGKPITGMDAASPIGEGADGLARTILEAAGAVKPVRGGGA